MLIFRSRATSTAGKGALPFFTPSMEITVRGELEKDLNGLALAVEVQTSRDHTERHK
jgi:hypothetical protein